MDYGMQYRSSGGLGDRQDYKTNQWATSSHGE